MMEFADIDNRDVLFTHFEDGTGVQTTFNITKLEAYCKAHVELCEIPVTKADAEYIRENRGIEPRRLERLRALAPENYEPIILCAIPDATFLLVDGSHRYVSLADAGKEWARAYLVKEEEWKQFVVHGAPRLDQQKLIKGYSGL